MPTAQEAYGNGVAVVTGAGSGIGEAFARRLAGARRTARHRVRGWWRAGGDGRLGHRRTALRGSFTFANLSDAGTLDPARCGTNDWGACSAVFGTLLTYDATTQTFGPGMAESFTSEMTLTRNPDYWDAPRPSVDTLVLKSIPSEDQRINAVRSGDVDAAAGIQPATGAKVRESGLAVTELAYPLGVGLRMNFDSGDLADRQDRDHADWERSLAGPTDLKVTGTRRWAPRPIAAAICLTVLADPAPRRVDGRDHAGQGRVVEEKGALKQAVQSW